jgi:hypothetical protein
MTLMTGVLLLFSCGISGAEHLTKACDELRLANEAIKVHDDAAIAAHLQAAKVHATEAVKNGDDKTCPNAVVVSAVLDKYPSDAMNATLGLVKCDEVGSSKLPWPGYPAIAGQDVAGPSLSSPRGSDARRSRMSGEACSPMLVAKSVRVNSRPGTQPGRAKARRGRCRKQACRRRARRSACGCSGVVGGRRGGGQAGQQSEV